jgi:hypothetical protein
MPMNTLLACAEELEVKGNTADQDPSEDLKRLADAGIDMGDVTKKLLKDGIDKFVEPFDDLIGGIELAREGIVTGGRRRSSRRCRRPRAADHRADPDGAVRERGEAGVVARRVALGRPRRGGDRQPARLAHDQRQDARARGRPARVRRPGEGGWPRARCAARHGRLEPRPRGDPALLWRRAGRAAAARARLHRSGRGARLEGEIDIDKTLFVVSSKSGGTIETLSHMRHFYERAGGDGSRFCAVTDPGSPLIDEANERGFRRVFENDPDIGGRYSVLSYFGLVPAVLAGVNIEGMLHQAQVAEQNCQQYDSPSRTPGLWLGCVMGQLAELGRDKLTFAVSGPALELRPVGRAADRGVHGQGGQGHPAVAASRSATRSLRRRPRVRLPAERGRAGRGHGREDRGARACGHPTATLSFSGGAGDLGRIFFFAEFATAVAGWALGINPFDQPNVQEAKDNTARILKEGLPDEDRARSRTCWPRPSRRSTSRSSASSRPLRSTTRRPRAAHEAPRAHPVHDDVRLRAALSPLDRAVPQGRPRERAVHPALPARLGGRGDPRRRLLVRAPEERAGAGRHADASRPRLEVVRIEVDGPDDVRRLV